MAGHTPELLAPAGSMEAFHAAFRAGADAFYMGLPGFSARNRAKNFSEGELRDAMLFSHKHGKKVYITLNILLFDREIPRAMEILSYLEEIGADGVIIQDLGLFYLMRKYFPKLKAHASTQLFCHNSLQARFLKERGADRVILARELTLEEIREIREKVPMDYEVFIHGAMCFSFSGCCLFSSYLFGESGNRGRCRQPCRFPFRAGGKTLYPFSMRDLAGAGVMGELIGMGVRAFKIEGRLKNAQYVFDTVSAYRRIIDACLEGKAPREESFGRAREAGGGYLRGYGYRRLVQDRKPGTVGERIGDVLSVKGKRCLVASALPLRKGMKLRIADGEGRWLYEGTLLHFSRKGTGRYEWTLDRDLPGTDAAHLYLTGESLAGNEGDIVRREAGMVKDLPLELEILLGTNGITLRGKVDRTLPFTMEFPTPTQEARRSSMGEGRLREIFMQVDRYPFSVGSMTLKIGNGVFISPGDIKKIRREFYAGLHHLYREWRTERDSLRREIIFKELGDISSCEISDKREALRYDMYPKAGQDITLIPFDDLKEPGILDRGTVILLPLFVSEGRLGEVEAGIEDLMREGFLRFMLPTYGWLGFFEGRGNAELFAGPHLYAVNSFSYRLLKERGVCVFAHSPDMKEEDVRPRAYGSNITPARKTRELMATRLRLPGVEYVWKDRTLRVRHFAEYDLVYEEG